MSTKQFFTISLKKTNKSWSIMLMQLLLPIFMLISMPVMAQEGESIQTVERVLKLRFEIAKDVLVDDSLNHAILDQLIAELKSVGSQLNKITVCAGISPEGRLDRSMILAKRRSIKVANRIRGYVPNNLIKVLDPVAYTWPDVVSALNERNDVEQGIKEQVSNIVANGKPEDVYRQLRRQQYYESVIRPILEDMRVVKVLYIYERE